jgi:hypothetical protein
MKTCRVCGETKPLDQFYKRASSPDGYRNDCKACRVAASSAKYYANHEANKEWHRNHHAKKLEKNPNWYADFYAKNTERIKEHGRIGYQRHRAKRLEAAKTWAKNNPGMANANKKAYKASKQRACPVWVREDEDLMWMMSEAYDLASMRTEMFGFAWHVDHIVPLRGKEVSGLHVPWNLQVIPGVENMTKSNKLLVS